MLFRSYRQMATLVKTMRVKGENNQKLQKMGSSNLKNGATAQRKERKEPPGFEWGSEGGSERAREFILAQDLPDLAAGADGQQQGPGQQRVGVQRADLGAHGGAAAVAPRVRVDEEALEALHGGVHVLQDPTHAMRGRANHTRPLLECVRMKAWERNAAAVWMLSKAVEGVGVSGKDAHWAPP